MKTWVLLSPLLVMPLGFAPRATPPGPLPRASVEASATLPCVVRVEKGWARMIRGQEILTLGSWAPEQAILTEGFVELGARSRIAVAWSGRASARIVGNAAFSVSTTRGSAEPDSIRLQYASSAELEARRGILRVELGGDWAIGIDRAALGVRELSDGRIEVTHRGGRPVRILGPADGSGEHDPGLLLRSGQRALLGRVRSEDLGKE